jgi:hypothetical protein
MQLTWLCPSEDENGISRNRERNRVVLNRLRMVPQKGSDMMSTGSRMHRGWYDSQNHVGGTEGRVDADVRCVRGPGCRPRRCAAVGQLWFVVPKCRIPSPQLPTPVRRLGPNADPGRIQLFRMIVDVGWRERTKTREIERMTEGMEGGGVGSRVF